MHRSNIQSKSDTWHTEAAANRSIAYPSYRSTKLVRAAQIANIYEVGDSYQIHFTDSKLCPVSISVYLINPKGKHQIGDFYVKNSDGHVTIWGKDLFEEAFCLLQKTDYDNLGVRLPQDSNHKTKEI